LTNFKLRGLLIIVDQFKFGQNLGKVTNSVRDHLRTIIINMFATAIIDINR